MTTMTLSLIVLIALTIASCTFLYFYMKKAFDSVTAKFDEMADEFDKMTTEFSEMADELCTRMTEIIDRVSEMTDRVSDMADRVSEMGLEHYSGLDEISAELRGIQALGFGDIAGFNIRRGPFGSAPFGSGPFGSGPEKSAFEMMPVHKSPAQPPC